MSALALSTFVAGAAPVAAQSPAPPITVQGAPADGDWGGAPADAAESPPPAATAQPAAAPPPAPPAKKKSAEVLPWADKPLVPATGDLAAVEAAAAQCSGLFEAACRDLKTCAWVADMALDDGTEVPARCAARPPAPPKKAAKKATPAKVTEKAPAPVTEAPAVKASVTRIEEEEPKAKPEPEKKKAAAIEEPQAPKEPKAPTIAEPKAPEAPAQANVGASSEEQQAAKAPIVVKPPSPPAASNSPGPSFGSMSPNMGGMGMGGNAVVVTVPPPSP